MQALERVINHAIDERIFPGCVIGVCEPDRNVQIFPFGTVTYDAGAAEVTAKHIYDVASITKAIPTASIGLKAVEEGKIALDTPVKDILPNLSCDYAEHINFKHLLTQTVDFSLRLSDLKECSGKHILDAIFSSRLRSAPGTTFFYCNATSILLGLVVEALYKKTLDVIASELFFQPLGMAQTSFNPLIFKRDAIVPTEIDPWRSRRIHAEIHDESAWKLKEIIVPGSAGLFSCVPDLLVFLQMLINRGEKNGVRYFSEQTIAQIADNQLHQPEACTGLGWELNQKRYMGSHCSDKTIGKTGFTGCVIMADLQKRVGIVFLSNYTWPQRKSGPEMINTVRHAVADSIFSRY